MENGEGGGGGAKNSSNFTYIFMGVKNAIAVQRTHLNALSIVLLRCHLLDISEILKESNVHLSTRSLQIEHLLELCDMPPGFRVFSLPK